jgi:hypothetical protein
MSDEEEFQTVPASSESINFPRSYDSVYNEVKLQKDAFIKAINKIFFAVGFETQREKFLYWALRIRKNKIRTVAGTGGRFAIYELEGSGVASSQKDCDILFLKNHTPVMLSLLKTADSKEITIKQSDPSDQSYQISIETGDFTFNLVGMNPNIQWVDEDKFLSIDYDYKVVTTIADWESVSKGISATYSDLIKKEDRIPPVKIEVDFKKNTILAVVDDLLKSRRKIKILDSKIKDDSTFTFDVCSPYINEIAERTDDPDGFVQLYFAEVENANSMNRAKKRPIVVSYYSSGEVKGSVADVEHEMPSGQKERYTIFFATLSE